MVSFQAHITVSEGEEMTNSADTDIAAWLEHRAMQKHSSGVYRNKYFYCYYATLEDFFNVHFPRIRMMDDLLC